MFISPFQQQKTAGRLASRPGLPYNAGSVGELAGKGVCHGNCGPNPQTAGHLGCLPSISPLHSFFHAYSTIAFYILPCSKRNLAYFVT